MRKAPHIFPEGPASRNIAGGGARGPVYRALTIVGSVLVIDRSGAASVPFHSDSTAGGPVQVAFRLIPSPAAPRGKDLRR